MVMHSQYLHFNYSNTIRNDKIMKHSIDFHQHTLHTKAYFPNHIRLQNIHPQSKLNFIVDTICIKRVDLQKLKTFHVLPIGPMDTNTSYPNKNTYALPIGPMD
jgi:hypothetical protein